VLAGTTFAVTKVTDAGQLVLGISLGIVTLSLATFTGSVRRRRTDRRTANGRVRSRGVASG
jgi:hypothetical protein